MKCFVPEISWHNRDPVYSLDIQPQIDTNNSFYRLASGGADGHVVIWHVALRPEDDSNQFASFECAADLQRHQKSVNVVRFSPNGLYLASGDDDGVIIVWKMRLDQDPPELGDENLEKDKETWVTFKILRGHLQDIYDLAWSPDCVHLVSGSIDNTAVLWNAVKGKKIMILGDHKGFVQGVAWDPKGKYIATLSTDRMLRVFDANKKKLIGRCYKSKLPWSTTKEKELEKKEEKDKMNKMFHNDTLKTFFRRLNFSPNGELLIAPCGIIEEDGVSTDASYVFTRGAFNKPAVHLPSPGQYTVAVRCCPVLFRLRGAKPGLFALPYRIVYAIATRSTLVLYDTEQSEPFGFVSNIHYTGLTDITWSPDGRLVVISSSEGYCSVITFDENEIGIPYCKEDQKMPSNNLDNEMDVEKHVEKSISKEEEKTSPICVNKDINLEEQANSKQEKTSSINVNKEMDLEKQTKKDSLLVDSQTNGFDTSSSKNRSSSKHETDIKSVSSIRNPMEKMVIDVFATPEKSDLSVLCIDDIKMTPEKLNKPISKITPEKIVALKSESMTPMKIDEFKTPDYSLMHTPMKITEMDYNDSQCSELSLVIEGDESELISKEEQARRLMSPYRGSPKQESPSLKRTPKAEDGSPKTPRSGRRVSLITLSSPKTKRRL